MQAISGVYYFSIIYGIVIFIFTIALMVLGIYALVLLIKALKIYIRKNSQGTSLPVSPSEEKPKE